MSFVADVRQWKSVAEFTAHLVAHNPTIAPWAQGEVIIFAFRIVIQFSH